MRIGVLGINHKLASLKLRETLSKACQKRFSPEFLTHLSHQFVLLSTCNRTEIYFSSDNLADTHTYLLNILRAEVQEDFDQKLYSFFGYDCFFHLNRVTAGLDSAVIAETEIQGQVKSAYELAAEKNMLSRDLHYLFQKTLKIGKKIRTTFPLKPGLPDLENAIFSLIKKTLSSTNFKILFIGASEINKKIVQFAKTKKNCQLTMCNRTFHKAYHIALKENIKVLEWNDLNQWNDFDVIIARTKSPQFLLHQENYVANENPKVIFDLSVPRNVEPNLAFESNIHVFNIDQINDHLQERQQYIHGFLAKIEDLIYQETSKSFRLFKQKEIFKEQFASCYSA